MSKETVKLLRDAVKCLREMKRSVTATEIARVIMNGPHDLPTREEIDSFIASYIKE